nr:MAG TPA: hypothetical protein [Caudoviricetes sp.]
MRAIGFNTRFRFLHITTFLPLCAFAPVSFSLIIL